MRTGVLSLAALVVIIIREIAAPEEVLSGGRRAVCWAPTFSRTKALFVRPLVSPDDCRSLRLMNFDSSSARHPNEKQTKKSVRSRAPDF